MACTFDSIDSNSRARGRGRPRHARPPRQQRDTKPSDGGVADYHLRSSYHCAAMSICCVQHLRVRIGPSPGRDQKTGRRHRTLIQAPGRAESGHCQLVFQ